MFNTFIVSVILSLPHSCAFVEESEVVCDPGEWSAWSACSGCYQTQHLVHSNSSNTHLPPICSPQNITRLCEECQCDVGDWEPWSSCDCFSSFRERQRTALHPKFQCPIFYEREDCTCKEHVTAHSPERRKQTEEPSRDTRVEADNRDPSDFVFHDFSGFSQYSNECEPQEWSEWSQCHATCAVKSDVVTSSRILGNCALEKRTKTCSKNCSDEGMLGELNEQTTLRSNNDNTGYYSSAYTSYYSDSASLFVMQENSPIQIVTQEIAPIQLSEQYFTTSIEEPGSLDTLARRFIEPNLGQLAPLSVGSDADDPWGSPDCTYNGGSWTKCCDGASFRFRSLAAPDTAPEGCPEKWEKERCEEEEEDCSACENGDWSEWADCSCGGDTYRTRSIQQGGAHCNVVTERNTCNAPDCDLDCQLSEWSSFEVCDSECAASLEPAPKIRSRMMLVAPTGDGHVCEANVKEYSYNRTYQPPCPYICPIDPDECIVSSWSDYGSCSHDCIASTAIEHNQTRSMAVIIRSASMLCPSLYETRPCSPAPPFCVCEWGEWSACAGQCGAGHRIRSRSLSVPGNCPALSEVGQCDTGTPCDNDCLLSQWSEFESCRSPCPASVEYAPKIRSRMMLVAPTGDGHVCEANVKEYSYNRTYQPPCPYICPNDPEEYIVSNWSDYGPCSLDCLPNFQTQHNQTRTRAVIIKSDHPHPVLSESRRCEPPPNLCNDPKKVCFTNEWEAWGRCEGHCGTGVQNRERSVMSVYLINGVLRYQEGTAHCPELEQERECETGVECVRVNCVVGEWEDWVVTPPVKNRARTVLVQPDQHGAACPPLMEVVSCNATNCIVDCEWSEWGEWSDCPVECKDLDTAPALLRRQRERSVATPGTPGGTECTEEDGVEKELCDPPPPYCPRDCSVDEWSEWLIIETSPNVKQRRNRTVVEEAVNGGDPCPSLVEVRDCSEERCILDCVLSEWSQYSSCSDSCFREGVNPTKTRGREIVIQHRNGGKECEHEGRLQEEEYCTYLPPCCEVSEWSEWTYKQTSPTIIQERARTMVSSANSDLNTCPELSEVRDCSEEPCVLDCVLSEWAQYGNCSDHCVRNGVIPTRTRNRTAVIPPRNGGRDCDLLTEDATCDLPVIPTCEYSCQGGPEATAWTEWTACSAECGIGKTKRSRFKYKHDTCYKQHQRKKCESPCSPPPPPPAPQQDCSVGTWSDWSECQPECGGRRKRGRTRSVIMREGIDGTCPPSSQSRRCPRQRCNKTDEEEEEDKDKNKNKNKNKNKDKDKDKNKDKDKDKAKNKGKDKETEDDKDDQTEEDKKKKKECSIQDWTDWTDCGCDGTQSAKRGILVKSGKCRKQSRTRECLPEEWNCPPPTDN